MRIEKNLFMSFLFSIANMKLVSLAVVVVAAMFVVAVQAAEDKYTTKYDNIDIDEILQSDRLFTNYYKCLTDEGKCPPDARELKKNLPDALKSECSKCSEKQKATTDKVIRFMIDNKPNEWKVLQAKYDPEGIYIAKYKPEAEKRGIKV